MQKLCQIGADSLCEHANTLEEWLFRRGILLSVQGISGKQLFDSNIVLSHVPSLLKTELDLRHDRLKIVLHV
jgi:hypothetical protein